MKVKMTLEDFRKEFKNRFPSFYLRVRDVKDIDSNKDLAYYNGNKAFEVEKLGNNNIQISFPINVYTCNTSHVQKVLNEENEEATRIYKENLIKVCQGLESYFTFTLEDIKFYGASSYDKEVVTQNFESFKRELSQIGINSEDIEMNIKSLKKKNKGKEEKTLIEGTVYNKKEKTISKDIKQIINAQFEFIRLMKLNKIDGTYKQNKLIKDISFSFNANPKIAQNYSDNSLENFRSTVISAINAYKGKDELEKKYQHLFMLYGDKATNIFDKTAYPFEEEYEIKKEKGTDKGRVDCVFYSIDKNTLKMTDLYLIEIKVDETVIAENNGVLTHLCDIRHNVNNIKYFNEIVERIEYRIKNKAAYDYGFKIRDIENFKLNKEGYNKHFYTIVGLTNDDSRKQSIKLLKQLSNKQGVEELINAKQLDKDLINETICSVKEQIKDDIDVKFFFERENWDKEMKERKFVYDDIWQEMMK